VTIKRILVPVDFSTNSLQAVDYAIDFAKPWKAELQLVFVVEPIYYTMSEFAAPAVGELVEEQRRSGRAELIRLESHCARRKVKVRAVLQVGRPYQAIVDTAKQLKSDLIIMATHGRTGMSHLLLGSVAERVVRFAGCPVLTVHPTKKARRAAPRTSARKAAPTARRMP
jgi:nucleotide-binding universal stress UspA family protein